MGWRTIWDYASSASLPSNEKLALMYKDTRVNYKDQLFVELELQKWHGS